MKNEKLCLCCGAEDGLSHFKGRTFEVGRGSYKKEIQNLSGFECRECGEIFFDDESASMYSHATDKYVIDSQKAIGLYIKGVRRKLKITQKVAVEKISGGGHNAFSRYEKAEVSPSKSLVLLMYLLDNHPELLKEVENFSLNSITEKFMGKSIV